MNKASEQHAESAPTYTSPVTPQYRSRVNRLMDPDDTANFFRGTFEVTDNQVYTFRPSELRWLSVQILQRQDQMIAAQHHAHAATPASRYALQPELVWDDFVESV